MSPDRINAIDELYGAKFGVGALSIIGSLFASHLAHKKLEKQLEATPRIVGGLAGVKKVLGSQGLPSDFVVGRAPGLRNAIFSGASNPRIINAISQYSPDLAGKMSPESVDSASRNGMILFDPGYARAGVIAHEGGHAKIHAKGGLSGINQTYLRPVGEIVSAFSPVLGSAAGYSTASPLIGGLVGGISGALGSIPTIVNEAQATAHAKDYLDKSRHRMSTKENTNKALSHAYFSYLTPAIISALGGAASGAISGQIGKMEKGADYLDTEDEEGDEKPAIPKPVKPGLGLAATGLGLFGLGGAMIAPSAIDSVNRFKNINPSNDPIKSLDVYTNDGGNLLRSKFYRGFSGMDLIREARTNLPSEIKVPFTNSKIPLLGEWAKWGPHERQHYGAFAEGPISAEMQLVNELTKPNAENKWVPDLANENSLIDKKILTPLRGLIVSHQIKSKVKDLTGKQISQLSPEEQANILPQVREKINSIPIIGKIHNQLEQDIGRNIQGGPGYEGKGHVYNRMVISPLDTLRRGLLYAGAGLAAGGGAYALYKYMQYRKQKAEQQKREQKLQASYGLLPKTASALNLPLSASLKDPVGAIDAANQVVSPTYHATNTIGNVHSAAKFIGNKSMGKPVPKAIAPIASNVSRILSPISKAVPALNIGSMATETAGLIAHPGQINDFASKVETQPALQRAVSGYMNPITSISSFANQSSQLAGVTAQNAATEYNNVLKSPINTQRSESISLPKNRLAQQSLLTNSGNHGLLAPNSPNSNNLSKSGLLTSKTAKPADLAQNNIQTQHEGVPVELQGKFKPDYTPEQLQEMGVYREVYGKKDGPRLASLESWPAHWYHPEDKMGWLEWYKKYSAGRRMEDDTRQIKRWLAFKARHGGAAFQDNPTPRRAYALRNWGVDPTKLVDNPQALSDAMNVYKLQKYRIPQSAKTAGIESFARTLAQYETQTGHIKQQIDLLRNGAKALQKRKGFLIPHDTESALHGLPTSANHLSDLKNQIQAKINELSQNEYVKGLGSELHGIAHAFGIK